MSEACRMCGHTHPSDAAKAIGRFSKNGPSGYAASIPSAPVRASRKEAEQDYCANARTHQHIGG